MGFYNAFLLIGLAASHGLMSFPRPRNMAFPLACPHCANGRGVCGGGGQWSASITESDRLNGSFTPLTFTVLRAGGWVEVESYFTAAHRGHVVVELCIEPGSIITDDCFVRLERDSNDSHWSPYVLSHPAYTILPEDSCAAATTAANPMRVRYRVPAGSETTHGLLRWYWQTGNSCDSTPLSATPTLDSAVANWSSTLLGRQCAAATGYVWASCGTNCPHSGCSGEQFKNCADVSIITGSADDLITSDGATSIDVSTTEPPYNPDAEESDTPCHHDDESGIVPEPEEDPDKEEPEVVPEPDEDLEDENSSGNEPDGSDIGMNFARFMTYCRANAKGITSQWDDHCKDQCAIYSAASEFGAQWCVAARFTDLVKCFDAHQSACNLS